MLKSSLLCGTVAGALFFLAACSGGTSSGKPLDTPISGDITISVDESYTDMIGSMIDAFQLRYADAHITAKYKSEAEVAHDLLTDSTLQVAVMGRDLNDNEKKHFSNHQFTTTSVKLGTDAVAFVVNPENIDTTLTVEQLQRLLQQQDTSWNQIDPKSSLGKAIVVFDNSGSTNARLLSERLMNGKDPGSNCYAVKSNDSVFAYVARTPTAIGVISASMISNTDDPKALSRLDHVKIVSLKATKQLGDNPEFVPPFQSYIADGSYPLTRTIWLIKIGGRASLGTGFATFAAGNIGQLIVQRAGLVPETMPERTIILK
jgi:phosphate transport system substrate-binding protein